MLVNDIKKPIKAEVKKFNRASIRVAEYVGMSFKCEKEGIMYFSKE
ncbi:hypothetical protein ES703_103414 [subsurface metagenome]